MPSSFLSHAKRGKVCRGTFSARMSKGYHEPNGRGKSNRKPSVKAGSEGRSAKRLRSSLSRGEDGGLVRSSGVRAGQGRAGPRDILSERALAAGLRLRLSAAGLRSAAPCLSAPLQRRSSDSEPLDPAPPWLHRDHRSPICFVACFQPEGGMSKNWPHVPLFNALSDGAGCGGRKKKEKKKREKLSAGIQRKEEEGPASGRGGREVR